MFILEVDTIYASRHLEFLKGSYFLVTFKVTVSMESLSLLIEKFPITLEITQLALNFPSTLIVFLPKKD